MKGLNRALLALVQTLALAAGCVPIDGGAVEARWVLRNVGGIAVSCDASEAQISAIRFELVPQDSGDDPCLDERSCRFPCDSGVGTTHFVIPEGRYAISLRPLDATGEPLTTQDGIQVPAPIIREVRAGQITNLNANLIIVNR